jgi:hypothetical protein
MIHIRRKQPSNKANYVLPILLMLGVFAFSRFGVPLIGDTTAIDPKLYMLMIPASIIGFLLVFYIFVYAAHPYFRGKSREKKAFTAQYGSLKGLGYKWGLIVSVMIAFLPLAFIGNLDNWQWFIENRALALGMWGVIGGIPVALYSIDMRRASGRLLKFVNEEVPDTRLHLTDAHIGQEGYLLTFDGTFRGREVAYHGEIATNTEEIEGQIQLKVTMGEMPKEFTDLHITDRKPHWRSYKGTTIDEIFEKRFEVTGADVALLPDDFKTVMAHMPRALEIHFRKDEFVFLYDIAGGHAPFYSYHGMVLFLDDMSEIAGSIR